jgi:hypothetical protein
MQGMKLDRVFVERGVPSAADRASIGGWACNPAAIFLHTLTPTPDGRSQPSSLRQTKATGFGRTRMFTRLELHLF